MDRTAGGFSEEQFLEACAELEEPALAGADWQLLLQTSGISIYSLLNQETGLCEYKVFGVLESCPPALLADVYMDIDYRKQWDKNVKELYEKECDGKIVVYWEVKYPFPMSNRDVSFLKVYHQSAFQVLLCPMSIARWWYVQQVWMLSSVLAEASIKVFMYYFDNPGGQIPSWLINWATKNGVPNFLEDMAKACKTYLKKN